MRWEIQEDQIEVQTPAKLNLYLEVLGKRDDGFHELETIMTAIDLYDLIRIRKQDTNESSEQIRLNCKWSVVDRFYKSAAEKRGTELETDEPFGDLPTDESNLVFQAAQLFFGETGIEACVEIELLKFDSVGRRTGWRVWQRGRDFAGNQSTFWFARSQTTNF